MKKKKSALQKIDSLSSLKAKLEEMDRLEFPTPLSHCIYRVPPILRKVNQVAYTPTEVSIGPYHHGNKRFKSMEDVKLQFLYKFLKRTQEKSFDDFVSALSNQEGKIRRCYSEAIPMESHEFVRMILTDACFIIEYFLLCLEADGYWNSKLWSMRITYDLILLENQLPFFVLKDLFDLTFPNGYEIANSEATASSASSGGTPSDGMPFEFVTFNCFCDSFMDDTCPNEKLREEFTFLYFVQYHVPRHADGTLQVHHLCDMLRIFYVRLDQVPREDNSTKMELVYSASKLHDAGIEFKVNEDEIGLLELKYSKGVLEMPRIRIGDNTETMFRNVVAFEQCHFPSSRSMTDYMILLVHLVGTGKDVEVLVEKGIIKNSVGENEALASITKRLDSHTIYMDFNVKYLSLSKDLNHFCDSSYNRYKAIFNRQYWSTPWRKASVLGAILLLFLTLIQTISSVFALFQK